MSEPTLSLRCNCCRCVISQEQADEANEIYESENTHCSACAESLADNGVATIERGSERDRDAWRHASLHQGFEGDWSEWLGMDIEERQLYENGAACGDDPLVVVEASDD